MYLAAFSNLSIYNVAYWAWR